MVLLELVAFHEIAAGQLLPGLGVLGHHPDPVAGLGIDQVEADRVAIVLGAVEGDRTGDEGETQMAAPEGTLCHVSSGQPSRLH